MITDVQFIEMILVSMSALERNRKNITVRNINILYTTFLKRRFQDRNIRDLTHDELFELITLISRWKQDYSLKLVVDNTNGNKKETKDIP